MDCSVRIFEAYLHVVMLMIYFLWQCELKQDGGFRRADTIGLTLLKRLRGESKAIQDASGFVTDILPRESIPL